MKLHANAKTCPASRRLLCRRVLEQGRTVREAAEAAGVSVRSAYSWLARYRAEGEAGLLDRSSRPHRSPTRTAPARVAKILRLRQKRLTGQEIAERLGMAASTVSAVLRRAGAGRLRALDPTEPANRYERAHPGELVHIDVKKLAVIVRPGHRVHGDRRTQVRGAGFEYVHTLVDDATRLAYAEVLRDERKESVCAFLRRAVAWLGAEGVRVERVLTDNGPGYRSRLHREVCAELGIAHKRTRAYRPRTNGKVERFIQTSLRRWAYRRVYATSAQRTAALVDWLHYYNHVRPHGSLNRQTPAQRLAGLLVNNVAGGHT
jgi:transposase InsO family protein